MNAISCHSPFLSSQRQLDNQCWMLFLQSKEEWRLNSAQITQSSKKQMLPHCPPSLIRCFHSFSAAVEHQLLNSWVAFAYLTKMKYV